MSKKTTSAANANQLIEGIGNIAALFGKTPRTVLRWYRQRKTHRNEFADLIHEIQHGGRQMKLAVSRRAYDALIKRIESRGARR